MNDPEGRSERSDRDQEILHRIEALISRLLFWGALLSIVVAAAGLIIYIAKGGLGSSGLNLQDQLRHQNGNEPLVFVSISQIGKSLTNLSNPLAITALGLLMLLLIPVVTVALLVVAFFRERDYRYSAIAAIVLFILFVALRFGGA